ncbi:MAG: hypothetical protein KIG97_01500 [Fibrobacter sp.]|nr:hypothetical protein [Fibrobacter sp.]
MFLVQHLFIFIAFVLLLPSYSLAGESSASGDSVAVPKRESIALPSQSAYMGAGLSIGLAAGVFSPIDECDCMGTWQGQLEYFYSDLVSGSFEVRFFGGDLDRDKMVMYQRYRINVRFHNAYDDFAFFAAPFLGLENTSISEFRKQVVDREEADSKKTRARFWWQQADAEDLEETGDSSKTETNCGKLFAMDGFSIGLGLGGGYNVSRLFAVTGLVQIEYNFSKDVMLSLVPGVAFNLLEVWPWAKGVLRSTWISFEVGGQRYVHGGVEGWSNTFFMGLQLGA